MRQPGILGVRKGGRESEGKEREERQGERGSMASAEPVCQGEPWCSLTQEACYGRVLLGLDMGMGRVWNARLTGSFVQ